VPCLINDAQEVIALDDDTLGLVRRAVEHALATVTPGPLLADTVPAGRQVPGGMNGWQVSVTMVDDETIAGLNEEWLGHTGPTDVISFSQVEGGDLEADYPPGVAPLLGDVVVSVDTARRQAVDYGHPWQWELAFLAVHGTLHLLGYDDGVDGDREAMMRMQETILSEVTAN